MGDEKKGGKESYEIMEYLFMVFSKRVSVACLYVAIQHIRQYIILYKENVFLKLHTHCCVKW